MTSNGYLAPHIRSYFEDYLPCRRGVSAHTLHSYRDAVALFLRFAAKKLGRPAAKLQVADVTERLVLQFLDNLESKRNNSVQTRNHRLTVLRGLLQYASRRDPSLLEQSRRLLLIPLKRGADQPEIRYLEKAELNALFNAVDRDTPLGRRDYALLLFMYNTGARVQEAADTQVSWLKLESPCKADLLGKGRKWRTCPLWDSTAQTLRDLIAERNLSVDEETHLFINRLGQPMSRSAIADVVQKYARLAGQRMPTLKKKPVTPHTLRHTTAMHLLQSGVEINVICSWLGHVSVTTTNRYVEIDLQMKAKALESCRMPTARRRRGRWQSKPDILKWLESL